MNLKTHKQNILRLIAMLLTILLFSMCLPVAFAAESGSCGDSLQWQFEDGTLTITGSGAMWDFSEKNKAPWDHLTDSITRLSLPEGLTGIGNRAFYNCQKLHSLTIPGSVKTIGEAAFFRNKSVTTLTLNEGLTVIKRSAFEDCTSLIEVRIPGTVTEIGSHAFYCCSRLAYVRIPDSVKTFGTGIFSYCSALSRVDVYANVAELPGWSFYGCENLDQLNTENGTVDVSEWKTTTDPVPLNPSAPAPQDPPVETQAPVGSQDENEPAPERQEASLVERTDDSTTILDVVVPPENSDEPVQVEVTTTIINPEGWNDVVDMVESVQGNPEEDKNKDPLYVTVHTPGNDTVPEEILQSLVGQNVNVEINTESGIRVIIDCRDLNAEDITSDLDLSYTITRLEQVPDGIDASAAYSLRFHTSCRIKMEVMIRMPLEYTRRAAGLFQEEKKNTQEFLQSVIVDDDGYAHFYLASIDKDMKYCIALDLRGEYSEQAIIPDEIAREYDLIDHSTGKMYKITGRKSSWNMGLNKVMIILAVVMVSVMVVVGFVMYFWNKQKLKSGYVPDLDDDE